jgi:predicted TIM-barrel fold metal-dependent hydrolase
MIDGFRVYDTHTHIGRALHSGREYTADDLLREMDAVGADRALIIPYPVVADYREQHDVIGAALLKYPDRFTGAACFPAFLPEATVREELRRMVEQYGVRVLKFQPQFSPMNPLGRPFEALCEAAAEQKLVMLCHTGSGAPFALPALFIHAARLFPEMSFVLAHSGGTAYYLEAIVAAEVCGNVYLELSSLSPHHVTDVLGKIPATRLMIGSDLPESQRAELTKIIAGQGTREEREAILWNTPRRVFDGEQG